MKLFILIKTMDTGRIRIFLLASTVSKISQRISAILQEQYVVISLHFYHFTQRVIWHAVQPMSKLEELERFGGAVILLPSIRDRFGGAVILLPSI
jgi:hypothetical protein